MRSEQTAFYNACRAAGIADSPDHNAPDASGVGPCPVNNPNGIRWSTALGYLDMARHRLNLTIKANCTVHRILFDGKRAIGVEVASGGETFTAEAEEIILSSGAIGSPQILMLSGVGPAGQLQALGIPVVHDLPGAGQNMREHPMVYVTFRTKKDHPMDGFAPRVQMALRYTAPDSDLRYDIQVLMQSFATGKVNLGGDRMEPLGIRMLAILNLAVGSGELRLTSADPSVQPFLDYRYFEDEFDRRRMREAIRLCVKLGQDEGFKDIVEDRIEPTDAELASDDALDVFMRREVTTGQHISCTCKMGPSDDPMSVVDQYGKVHGLQNLRVVDASIMPDCVRANTNVTTMMIGEHIADFIRQGS